MRITVTGARGFLGRCVCAYLEEQGHSISALVRRADPELRVSRQHLYTGLEDEDGARRAIRGAEAVIHLAARVHQMRDDAADIPTAYHRINTSGTRGIAWIAAQEGVREFHFASSVKVMGEENDRAWTERDTPRPADPYGLSKLEAERALAEITEATGMATVVLRLPLSYGPGMKANMLQLFRLVDMGIPLPLGGIDNARSLLYSGNAAASFGQMLGKVRTHEVCFASDGDPVSTPQLVRDIGSALGKTVHLLPAPLSVLRRLAKADVPRASHVARRLTGSLTVDVARLRDLIGPLPFTRAEGLNETAIWYRRRGSRP